MKFQVINNDWDQVQRILESAMSLAGAQRQIFIENKCRSDKWLYEEVTSLIQALEKDHDFLEEPVFDLGLKVLGQNSENLVGTTIGYYEIEGKLGEGGMGEVYVAKDTRLDRQVALKVLANPYLDDKWARRQMFKEARAAAMLDHPNICPVYGAEEIGGCRVIAMQYIRGDTLSSFIRSKNLASESVVPIARQIADAIAAAHSHGIIHCDIKPGNIMLTAEGQAKVLDFGLAKVIRQKAKSDVLENSLSLASQTGLIQGTVHYMSPEQLKGEKLDYKSDIFSFGTVFFEMLTGVNPFDRKSDAETISEILSLDSPLDRAGVEKVPSEWRPLIRKCLEKDKARRYASMDEVVLELQSPTRIPRNIVTRYARWTLLTVFILLVSVALFVYSRTGKVHTAAVMPFRNETADSSLDYLADGLTEGIITKLSGADRLQVRPFTVVSGYRDSDVDNVTLGRKINADLVIKGSIRRDGDKLTVETSLFDASRGVTVRTWNERFDQTEILNVEKDLASGYLASLSLQNSESAESNHRGSTTNDPEAFRQYMTGRHLWRKRDKANLQLAIEAFQKSIDLDPGFSLPYTGLADSYVLCTLAGYGIEPTKVTMTKARVAAKQALEIDPRSAAAHTSLGTVLTKYDWDWSEAEKEYRLATELDPEYAAAHYYLSDLLALTGRADESIKEAERARELDPFSQQETMNLARTYYYARRYDQVLDLLGNGAKENTPEVNLRYMIGLTLLQKQMNQEALAVFEQIAKENRTLVQASLSYTYVRLGNRDAALDILNELKETKVDDHPPFEELAFVYIALGDDARALSCLEEAYKDRHAVLVALKVEPLFDPIRGDKRFNELLKKMSLS